MAGRDKDVPVKYGIGIPREEAKEKIPGTYRLPGNIIRFQKVFQERRKLMLFLSLGIY